MAYDLAFFRRFREGRREELHAAGAGPYFSAASVKTRTSAEEVRTVASARETSSENSPVPKSPSESTRSAAAGMRVGKGRLYGASKRETNSPMPALPARASRTYSR